MNARLITCYLIWAGFNMTCLSKAWTFSSKLLHAQGFRPFSLVEKQ